MEQALLPWLARAVAAYEAAMAVPAVRSWTEILLLLAGFSGAFWAFSRLLGRVAFEIHESLDRSLGDLFAVAYNVALAVLYASIIVQASISERGGKDDFLAFQAAGFAVVYLVLSGTYREASGRLEEHALPGFWAGLLAYLVLCLRTQFLANPLTQNAYAALSWLLKSGWGRYLTYLAAAVWLVHMLRRLPLLFPKMFPAGRGRPRMMKRMRTKDI